MKYKNIFKQGAIKASFIGEAITKHQSKSTIGAHNIFLGQVRADKIENQRVGSIEYTAYEEMAKKVFHDIHEEAFAKFDLTCMHIYHSLGNIKVGEICLFVFVSAPHRKETFKALEFVVERIKAEAPVFGKEIFDDESYQWKVNI